MKLTKQWLCRFSITRTLVVGALGLAAITISAGNADADWHSFWHKFHVDTARNNAWPDPFNEADARDVVAPFEVMKQNGWKLHNTIGHDLFREGDGVLMASGTNAVHWIATQAPPSRRSIYVLQGKTQLETEARLASVRQALASMNLNGDDPSVQVTSVEPAKASGVWAAKISRDGIAATPRPQLPQTSASGAQSVAVPSGQQ
jgi:hypothetical protein